MSAAAPNYEVLKLAVQIIGYVVGWVVVAVGWNVAWSQALRREDRKELRDLVDRLIDLCHQIERRSINFLTKAPTTEDPSETLHIRNDISRLSRALSRLKTEIEFDCTEEVMALRQSITRGAFDSADRKALDLTSPGLQAIGVASLNLVDKIEDEYTRLAPRKRTRKS